MAAAKAKKIMPTIELPECPVCMETMSKPIYQCQSGHSLCNSCTSVLCPPICPICRQPMTQMRNWQLEDIIAKARVPCPNKPAGCVYSMANDDIADHLKECIFREMECPLGVIFGRCSWTGKIKNLMDHFKDRHPTECSLTTDSPVEIENINIKVDDRKVFLVAQAKLLFIFTFKIDTSQKMAYWAIQHIGGKKVAQQHIYEIHVTSNQDDRRKAVFIEHCFNDAIKSDEVFRQAKCAILPLNSLNHFVKDKKLSFRFFIKRLPPPQNNKNEKGDGKSDFKQPHNKGPKGPGSSGQPNFQMAFKGPKKFNRD